MKNKLLASAFLLIALSATVQSQELTKEQQKAQKREEKLKKVEFPIRGVTDPVMEKKMIEVVKRSPAYLELEGKDVKEIKILHMTNYNWWVKKNQYGEIQNLNMRVYVGYTKTNGRCYMRSVLITRQYLGGGNYMEDYGIRSDEIGYSDYREMSCSVLDSLVAEDIQK
ncbi:MAG: hypothetical protein V4506_09250 [Bacteroidota bacterium]